MKITELRRQGDVMIGAIDSIPKEASEVERKEGEPIVLAHGEVTGHKHAIYDDVTESYNLGADVFVNFLTTPLKHEEHAPLTPRKGPHIVIRQVEYTPAEVRNVAD